MKQPFIHKKSLGQHFLNNDLVPQWMVEAGKVESADTVLEIGPGTGALTKHLLRTGATVIALEADERAVIVLQEVFASEISTGQLKLHHHDVRTLNLADIGLHDQSFKVVSNIPYYLSGYLFRTMTESLVQPTTLVFLVQKEVGKRAVAVAGQGEKPSLLSIALQVYGNISYVRTVSKGHFTPPPKIDSAIIALSNITRNNFSNNLTEKIFFSILHHGFGQKRKQLQGNLRAICASEHIKHALLTCGLPHDIRAEDLSLKNWLELATLLSPHLIQE